VTKKFSVWVVHNTAASDRLVILDDGEDDDLEAHMHPAVTQTATFSSPIRPPVSTKTSWKPCFAWRKLRDAGVTPRSAHAASQAASIPRSSSSGRSRS
jgi:hypothetical protein